jgi:hypothetical protein
LEGSQVLYWITLAALRQGIEWAALRPDRALVTRSDELPTTTLLKLLRAEANHWAESEATPADAARLHAALALVGQALAVGDIAPEDLIAADLAELYARPYMASYSPPH